jgi:hypothetical protein
MQVFNDMLKQALEEGYQTGKVEGLAAALKVTKAAAHSNARGGFAQFQPFHAPILNDVIYEFATPVLNTILADVTAAELAALKKVVMAKYHASDKQQTKSTRGLGSWHSGDMLNWQAPEVATLGAKILDRM